MIDIKTTCRRLVLVWAAALLGCCASAWAAEVRTERFGVRAGHLDQAAVKRIGALAEEELDSLTRWFGVQVSGEIELELFDSEIRFREAVGPRVPGWASAIASGHRILIGPRGGGRVDDIARLRGVVRHELSHVLLHGIVPGPGPPKWFDEGLAVLLSNEWDHVSLWQREVHELGSALRTDRLFALEEITRSFPADALEARTAYLQSHAFVHYLAVKFGSESLRRYVMLLGRGLDPDAAAREAFGASLDRLFDDWRDGIRGKTQAWQRVLYDFNSIVFMFMGVLALVAFGLYLVRRRALLRRYEEYYGEPEPEPEPDMPPRGDFELLDFNRYMKRRRLDPDPDPDLPPETEPRR